MQTFTITFCESAENHVGNQRLGDRANSGFSEKELLKAKKWFEKKGKTCQIYHLNNLIDYEEAEDAFLLVVKDGLDSLLGKNYTKDEFFSEQDALEKDKKCLMRGRVVNKHARHNLCFADSSQNPDYSSGKGTVVSFSDVPILSKVRNNLPRAFGEKAKDFLAEGNYYYDVEKCYIGFHGDSERKKVVGVRTGEEFPLYFQWYYKTEKVGELLEVLLEHGDVYAFSEKAVGTDWKKRNTYTLRHAAGSKKKLGF